MDGAIQFGGGSMVPWNRRGTRVRIGHASDRVFRVDEMGRKSTADAALERRSGNEIGCFRGEGKRKATHPSESSDVVRCPRKRNRNSFDAIVVDDSGDLKMDEIDEDENELDTTVAACGQSLNSNVIPKKSKNSYAFGSNFGVQRCQDRYGGHVKSDSESRR